MEFYGSRYTPKRYHYDPIVVSTEYYDYTSSAENLDGESASTSSSQYRVMPITYDDCPPAYWGNDDAAYNIQSYGSNVVLPFTACIEIYNNKSHHPHHHHHHHHQGVGAGGRMTPPTPPGDSVGSGSGVTGVDYNSTGEDEIIINVRHVPMCCSCCGRQGVGGGAAPYGAGGPPQPPQPPHPIYRTSRYDLRETPVKYFRYDFSPKIIFDLDFSILV